MKERDDAPEPEVVAPERSHPPYITAGGLAFLQRRLESASDAHEREVLEHRIASAVVVDPPSDRDVVAFGATVVVSGAAAKDRAFTIVGEDEADIPAGKIGFTSPLAEALLGARVGDDVVWHRPAGDRTLRVRSITY